MTDGVKNMHVLFDLWSVQPISTRLLQGTPSKFNGGAEYAKVVFFKLLELREEEKISGFYNPEKEMPLDIKKLIKEKGIELFPVKTKSELQSLIKNGIFDKFYSALPYNYYDIDFSNVEVIFTIHGLRPLEMPRDKYELKYDKSFTNTLKYAFKTVLKKKYLNMRKKQFFDLINVKAKKKTIVVPTYHTKYSLINYFPNLGISQVKVLYSPQKVSMFYHQENEENLLKKIGVKSKEYFLIISGDRWIKNSYRAIKALDEIFSAFDLKHKKALILGMKNENIFRKYVHNKEKFIFWPYVNEEQLEILYKNAFLFIYPTLNEGFGYPPLESMKYGTPVICSAISATVEVCRDAAIYFNPFSIDEMKNRILFAMFERDVYEKYSALGKKRYEIVSKKQQKMLNQLCKSIIDL